MSKPSRASRYPVSSFGPELMAILVKGSTEEVRLPCPDRKTMRNLQARLHMLRGAMAREKHQMYEVVTRARTSQSWKIGGDNKPHDWALVVRPQDSQFADIIKKAGITVEPADAANLILDVPEPVAPPEPTVLAATPDPYARFK